MLDSGHAEMTYAARAGLFCSTEYVHDTAIATGTACCMLQLLCLSVQQAVELQVHLTEHRSAMTALLAECKAMHQAGITAQDARMTSNRALFQEARQLQEASLASAQDFVPHLGAPSITFEPCT